MAKKVSSTPFKPLKTLTSTSPIGQPNLPTDRQPNKELAKAEINETDPPVVESMSQTLYRYFEIFSPKHLCKLSHIELFPPFHFG